MEEPRGGISTIILEGTRINNNDKGRRGVNRILFFSSVYIPCCAGMLQTEPKKSKAANDAYLDTRGDALFAYKSCLKNLYITFYW